MQQQCQQSNNFREHNTGSICLLEQKNFSLNYKCVWHLTLYRNTYYRAIHVKELSVVILPLVKESSMFCHCRKQHQQSSIIKSGCHVSCYSLLWKGISVYHICRFFLYKSVEIAVSFSHLISTYFRSLYTSKVNKHL